MNLVAPLLQRQTLLFLGSLIYQIYEANDIRVKDLQLALSYCRRNHVEIYRGHYHKNNDSFAVCSSLDVHPENSAIALRNDVFSDTSKVKVCDCAC